MNLSDRKSRKLMPMAAKAAGIRIEYDEDGSISSYWNEFGDVWEPLHDKDDAERLATSIGMAIPDGSAQSEQGRLFIVEAAAARGREMP